MVDNDNLLVNFDGTVVHLADADPADIFIVVDRADQYLRAGIGITDRGGNIIQDRLKQRDHVSVFII